ncbi:hypothetical protein DH2020_046411 [Rehmannia glutinosa]|uniref:Reverse transcriptase zinc-binding domain n=1 Tax=Rehmannia glutinosa TaxID=99300 RepID=A0ABR0UC39_REHGL
MEHALCRIRKKIDAEMATNLLRPFTDDEDLHALGKLHGIKINKLAPYVSHLFFADDTLLFGKATLEEAKNLKFAIQLYERCSGQQINFEKSSILFSPNTAATIRDSITQELRMTEPTDSPFHKVADLIDSSAGVWKEDAIRSLFSTSETNAILSIPVFKNSSNDLWVWHFTKNGKFTVRTAYFNLLKSGILQNLDHLQASTSYRSKSVWKKIWRFQIPDRAKRFIWRCCLGSIPTSEFLQAHNMHNPSSCAFCEADNPDANHTFFLCQFASNTWKIASLWDLVLKFQQPSFTLWCQDISASWDNTFCALFSVICDGLWFAHNKKIYEKSHTDPYSVVLSASNRLMEFAEARNSLEKPSIELKSDCFKARKPQGPTIYFDGAISNSGAGVGCAIFDDSGAFIYGISKKFRGILEAEIAETLALKEALRLGKQFNLSMVEIYGDAAAIILAANNEALFPISCAALEEDIQIARAQLSHRGIFCISRQHNLVAHHFACFAKNMNCDSYFWEDLPNSLCQSLLDDFQHH